MSKDFLEIDQENIFYLILVFVFRLDGDITEKEKEILSNYLRLSSQFQDDEGIFDKILSYRPPNMLQVLDYLRGLPSEEMRFYYLFQVAALTAYDHISPKQEKTLKSLAREVKLGNEYSRFLDDIFLKRNFSNRDALFIGNDAKWSDIMKCRENISAVVFRYGDSTYFMADRSEGLIRFNRRIVFDHIILKIDFQDQLEIKGEILSFADILFRFELKSSEGRRDFYIVRKQKTAYQEFLLTPEKMEGAISRLSLEGCHIYLKGIADQVSTVSIDGEPVDLGNPDAEIVGCVDNKILIENTFLFDLSQQIRALYLSDAIAAKIDQKRRISVGNMEECDLFVPEGSGGDQFVILIQENASREWEMDLSQTQLAVSVNGRPVGGAGEAPVPIKNGSVIGVGLHNIYFDPDNNKVELILHKIHHLKVENLHTRVSLLRMGLQDISFENRARDFTCIIGPSGCGKTTLIRTLAGYLAPDNSNSVQINGHAFFDHYDVFKNHIGYVSQEDVLFEHLTVLENMLYYGRVRAPHLGESELERRVHKVLADVGLLAKKDDFIGDEEQKVLSGGEKRRLNIALELIADVDLLFLDEPTSGLSSHDSLLIVQLLSYLAKMGKIIYVVIHQPSLEIYNYFSHLILLDKGGHLAFFGRTGRAFDYFSKYSTRPLKTPDETLEVLEAVRRTPDGEILYEEDARGNRIPMRVKSPRQWAEEYRQRQGDFFSAMNLPSDKENLLPEKVEYGRREQDIQFRALFWRNFKNKFRDRTSVIISVLIPAVLAFFIALVLRYQPVAGAYSFSHNLHVPKFLFLTGIIALFLAVSNSISEIFKDQVFLRKERLIAYSKRAYLLSKTAALAFIASYQILIFLLIAFPMLGIPLAVYYDGHVSATMFVKFFVFTWVAAMSMTAFSLYVSAYLRSEKAAFLAVPLIIVPQIIFGGMFLKFGELKSLSFFNDKRPVPIFCDAIHARWMYEAYLNIFRYDNPSKSRAFQNTGFENRYGNLNNQEVAALFGNYNLSSERDEDLKKKIDAETEKDFLDYVGFISEVEQWKVNPGVMFDYAFHRSLNFFPYYKKILYPFVIPTYYYNLLVMVFFFVLFYLLTLARLKVQHRLTKPSRFNLFKDVIDFIKNLRGVAWS